MRVVVDMNLSPDWVALLSRAGFDAQHWSRIANPRALDPEIMKWARQHAAVVLTHDLDFGATLALTRAEGPSVIQMRSEDVSPNAAGNSVISALRTYEEELAAGALIDNRRSSSAHPHSSAANVSSAFAFLSLPVEKPRKLSGFTRLPRG